MPRSIRNWVTARFRGKENQDLSQPPTLANSRPHQLTRDGNPTATASSAIFTHLPPEIRRKILIEAFGAQTVHIALDYIPSSNGKKSKEWRWHSSVCHRGFPSLSRGRRAPGAFPRDEPAYDRCAEGHRPPFTDCDYWPGERPAKCHVGAMGWLRTCRAGYAEGVEVLYGTNRFFVSGGTMLPMRLDEFLLPRRLDMIREVELVWKMDVRADEGRAREREMAQLVRMLERLPVVLPRLRYLYLSLQGRLLPIDLPLCSVEQAPISVELLRQVEDMVVARMEMLEQCCVALPASFFAMYEQAGKEKGLAKAEGREAIWCAFVEKKSALCYGIWLCEGQRDLPEPLLSEV